MKFSDAKREILAALREHRYQHEARAAQSQKNLLATGAISVDQAIGLVEATRGNQATSSPHHADASVLVWVFRPVGWYVKFYLVDGAWFISFHQAEP
ncbi:hypothetical protein IV102_10225 [bacterium]|nr:hypothetical protein [bacterium]